VIVVMVMVNDACINFVKDLVDVRLVVLSDADTFLAVEAGHVL
jgi:hypothetical protein